MVSKQNILDNVAEYSAEQLVEYIQQGIVNFDELVKDTDGEFDAVKRKKVKELLDHADEIAWKKVQDENTIEVAQWYLDTFPKGTYRNQARSIKAELEKQKEDEYIRTTTDDAWTLVDKDDINSIRDFIKKYPNSTHIAEAQTLINGLLREKYIGINADKLVSQIQKIETDNKKLRNQKDNSIVNIIEEYITKQKKVTKEDFLSKLADDHNLLSSGVVNKLVTKGVISLEDLSNINIDADFISKMLEDSVKDSDNDSTGNETEAVSKIEKIHKQSTEIYFWGIPSSGKSNALAAILGVAQNGHIAKSMDMDTQSQGYGYMNNLIDQFQEGKICTMVEGTAIDSFYEMGFDLIDNKGQVHPITCIDMAGELMRCMYKSNANMALDSKEVAMLDTMTKILIDNRSLNRKIHCFVIEYGAEDKLYEGKPQKTYLSGAASYIKDTGIFDKDTDHIFIMVTKADKMKNATKESVSKYIENKYLGFYNNLVQTCKDKEIDHGNVMKLAFSIGDVCFQNYCKFDKRPAENVVKEVLLRTASYERGIRGLLKKIFRG